jgi:hypothetical protein
MAGTLYPPAFSGHEMPAAPPPPPRWRRWLRVSLSATRRSAAWSGRILAHWWRHGSTNTRIALALAVVIAAIAGIRSAIEIIWPAPAYLRIAVSHSFHAAQIIVWLDDKEVINDVMTANASEELDRGRHSALLRRAESTWSASLPVSRGPHQVRLRVASTEEPFDRNRTLPLQIKPGDTTALQIVCNRGHMIAFAAAPEKPRPASSFAGFDPLQNRWFAHYSAPAMLGLAALAIASAVALLMQPPSAARTPAKVA